MKRRILPAALIFFLVQIHNQCFAGEKKVTELIDRVVAAYNSINDYQCRLHETSVLGNRYEKRIVNFYFKKPRMIRMDILMGNRPFDSGSVGVYTGGNKVIGHQGGILKSIVLTLPKKSPLATTIRGIAFDESDMQAVIERLIYLNNYGTVSIENEGSSLKFTCAPFRAADYEGITKEIAWADKKSLLISRNERYVGEKLVQEVEWKGYIVNAGLPDELFSITFKAEDLKKYNIAHLSQELKLE